MCNAKFKCLWMFSIYWCGTLTWDRGAFGCHTDTNFRGDSGVLSICGLCSSHFALFGLFCHGIFPSLCWTSGVGADYDFFLVFSLIPFLSICNSHCPSYICFLYTFLFIFYHWFSISVAVIYIWKNKSNAIGNKDSLHLYYV